MKTIEELISPSPDHKLFSQEFSVTEKRANKLEGLMADYVATVLRMTTTFPVLTLLVGLVKEWNPVNENEQAYAFAVLGKYYQMWLINYQFKKSYPYVKLDFVHEQQL